MSARSNPILDPNVERRLKREERHIPRIIPAYKILEQVSGSGYVEEVVNEILTTIEEDIQSIIDSPEKRNYSMTEVPTIFDVPGMTNQRAQMYVYYHVIRALKKSEFIPKVKFVGDKSHNQRVYFYVSWFSKDDVDMERYMNEYISSNTMNFAPDLKPDPKRTSGGIVTYKTKAVQKRRKK